MSKKDKTIKVYITPKEFFRYYNSVGIKEYIDYYPPGSVLTYKKKEFIFNEEWPLEVKKKFLPKLIKMNIEYLKNIYWDYDEPHRYFSYCIPCILVTQIKHSNNTLCQKIVKFYIKMHECLEVKYGLDLYAYNYMNKTRWERCRKVLLFLLKKLNKEISKKGEKK